MRASRADTAAGLIHGHPGICCSRDGYCCTGEIVMKKKKTMYDLMKEIRKTWSINPKTRVREDETKNKKKRRQQEKKMIRDESP